MNTNINQSPDSSFSDENTIQHKNSEFSFQPEFDQPRTESRNTMWEVMKKADLATFIPLSASRICSTEPEQQVSPPL
jgi:hypothetical protein